jgi:hypothetical protein
VAGGWGGGKKKKRQNAFKVEKCPWWLMDGWGRGRIKKSKMHSKLINLPSK